MKITLFSRHTPKSTTNSIAIMNDIRIFNEAMHTAYARSRRDKSFDVSRKEQGLPDRRTRDGKEHIVKEAPSVFLQLREKYGISTYFANSAVQEASAVLRSVKELHTDNVKEVKEQLSSVKNKCDKTKKRLEQLEKTKACLIAISRYNKHPAGRKPKLRMPKGSIETFDKETGVFTIWRYSNGSRIAVKACSDAYQFETQYLDPKIKDLRHRISMLENRIRHLEAKLASMKDIPGVCFGSKALFRKQSTVYAGDHDTWQRVYRKRRSCGMTISGRYDSADGNFVFRYDISTHTLIYKSMSGTEIPIPDVVFPHGQEMLEQYLTRQQEERSAPIAWRIEDAGGSFLVKCTLERPEPVHKNYDYSNGCIGMDTNVDCFALSETDRCGNLLCHHIVPFDLAGKTSAQAEQILSKALDQVFRICDDAKKPLVMERLKDVAAAEMYGSKLRNRKVSGFAHSKITELAVSKSNKYGIDVKFVNPAYTSQIGKVKYMSRYGLSVHEAAALVIARRGMGLKDRMPKGYIARLPEEKLHRHHWSHWSYFSKEIKGGRPHQFYRRNSARAPCSVALDLPF